MSAKADAEQFLAVPTREVGPFSAGQAAPAPGGGWQAGDDRVLGASIVGQQGWTGTCSNQNYDQEITAGVAHSGGHGWRLSNWYHNGCVNHVISPAYAPVGESGSTTVHGGGVGPLTNTVSYEFWFRTAATSVEPGTYLSTTITDQAGRRMTYLGFFDEPAAPGNGCPGDGACFHLDASGVTDGGTPGDDNTVVFDDHYSPSLNRGQWYRVQIDATFNDTTDEASRRNDVVDYALYDADGNPVWAANGVNTWEDAYYQGQYGSDLHEKVAVNYIAYRISADPDSGSQTNGDTYAVTNRPHGIVFDDLQIAPGGGQQGYATSFEYDRWVATTGVDTGDCSLQASPCRTIGYAVSQANAYDRVHVAAGTYAENVVVDKPLLISGAGAGATTVVPAAFNPDCSAGGGSGSLCSGGSVDASVLFLVKASDVDISALTVDGINPGISASIAARDGIMTDFRTGIPYTGFKVHDTVVQNIFLRGIYSPSTNGTFEFRNNTVNNVQSDPASIAIFNSTGGGVIDGNHVSGANDAISANHSFGTTFSNNVITNSASGIHTDNNHDSGGATPDAIFGNSVNCGVADGYGIWTFVPYMDVSIHDNTIGACAVGLGAFGGRTDAGALRTSTFQSNQVDGTGASASSGGTVGALLSTTTFFFGDYDNTAALTGNTIAGFDTGVVTQRTGGRSITTTAHFNRLSGNGVGWADDDQGGTGGTSDFTNNWWGCNTDPVAGAPCAAATGSGAADPWLVLSISASPQTIHHGDSSSITADLLHNSAGAAVPSVFTDGTVIAFAASAGNVMPTSDALASGLAQTTLANLPSGSATITASLENAVASVVVGIEQATIVLDDDDGTVDNVIHRTYDGSPQAVSATTGPSGLSYAVTYDGNATPPTAAGSYTIAATVTDNCCDGATSGTLVIEKAVGTVVFDGGYVYNGAAQTATAHISEEPGSSCTVTPAIGPDAGSYLVNAACDGTNWVASGDGAVTIAKAPSTVTINAADLQQTFGSTHAVGAAASPESATGSVAVTYDGSATPPSAVGTYSVLAVLNDSDYTGVASAVLHIVAANAPDLAVAVNADRSYVRSGGTVTYRITVSNVGNTAVSGATIEVAVPPELVAASWACDAIAGSNCTASGTGGIADTVDAPVGGGVDYVLTGTVGAAGLTTDQVVIDALVTAAGDANAANDTAAATTRIVIFRDGFEVGGDGAEENGVP